MSAGDWLPELCIEGLDRMRAGETALFSSRYLVDLERNEWETETAFRYTMNTLLGLARLRAAGASLPWDLEAIYGAAAREASDAVLGPANVGMCLWAASALGIEPPRALRDRAGAQLSSAAQRRSWTAQDYGWMASGLAATGDEQGLAAAHSVLRSAEAELLVPRTGLFRYVARGLRRTQASFGGLTYMTHAFLHFASLTGDAWAREVGARACRAIVALQGPQGEWPWVVDAERARVTDWYPVYSVHQDAMAPLFLTLGIDVFGLDLAGALAKSVGWIFGENQLGLSMVDPRRPFIYRSIQRTAPFPKLMRGARMLRAAVAPAQDRLVPPPAVRINRECRSYHLGWILYAWATSASFREAISAHPAPPRRWSAKGRPVGASRRLDILGVPLDAMTLQEVVGACCSAVSDGRQIEIGVVNAAKLVGMREDPGLRASVLNADLVVADGMSVVWAGRLLGSHLPERVAGIDLFETLLVEADRRGITVYLLGATEAVLGKVVERIRREFPALRVAGARNGYFDPSAEPEIAADIRRSGADLLFIAITSPRKEKFIAAWSEATGCKVLHGVGGSFDVFAGHVARAPLSWQRLGVEWLYRVLQEPKRLWWRYARTNSIFAGLVATGLVRRLTAPLSARGRSPVSWTD